VAAVTTVVSEKPPSVFFSLPDLYLLLFQQHFTGNPNV
jgi:hypothetical protein